MWTLNAGVYSFQMHGTGDNLPLVWSGSFTGAASWLSISSAGTLSGTPTGAGTFNFSLTVTDADALTSSRSFTLIVAHPGPQITETTLPMIVLPS